jgi:UDP-N-acetylmuramoyl-tripeptide--D-alanyl-D-alanine ligase
MNLWDKESLGAALNIKTNIQYSANRIEFNSANVQPDDLFIAMKGARDGHFFVQDALNRGASCALVEYHPEGCDISRLVLVESCLDALNNLAKYNRSRLKAKIIAITGSVGKTSTKEAFALASEGFGKIFSGRGNFNNHLGLPMNIASIPLDTDYVILELGMNHAGEIRYLSKMLKPDVAIITKIAPAHLAFFSSVKDIALAKSEIFEGLSENGVAIFNKDDEYFDVMHQEAFKYTSNIRTFGTNHSSDIIVNGLENNHWVYSC